MCDKVEKRTLDNKINYSSLDLLKLIMSFIVVGRHIGGGSYATALTCCAVPTFFIISGFLVRNSEKNNGGTAVLNQIKRIMKLYMVWSLIYMPLWIIDNRGKSLSNLTVEYIQQFLFGGSYWHLWYLPSLVFAMIFFQIGKKVFKNNPGLILSFSLICYLIGLAGDSYSGIFQRVAVFDEAMAIYRMVFMSTRNGLFYGFFFYSIGYYMDFLESKLFQKVNAITIAGIGIVMGIVVTCLENKVLLAIGYSTRQNMYMGTAVIAICSVVMMKHLTKMNFSKDLSVFMRRMSTIIYMIHIGVFAVVGKMSGIIGIWGIYVTVADWICTILLAVIICKMMETSMFRKLKILC